MAAKVIGHDLSSRLLSPRKQVRAGGVFTLAEQRQSYWPDDNYFGRFIDMIIWYPGAASLDHGSTGSSTEAEADGRQDTTGSGGVRNE